MTREHLPRLREMSSDADPLARILANAERGPSPERLARLGQRLSDSLDARSTTPSPTPASAPLSAAARKWLAGVGVAGIALAFILNRGPEAEPARPSSAPQPQPKPSQVVPDVTTTLSPASRHEELEVRAPESIQPAATPRMHSSVKKTPSGPTPSELTLLREAQQALPNYPQLALTRLAEHRAAYPHGVLEQERQVLHIEALLRSNHVNTAREIAAAFASEFPLSAHLRRIERMFARIEQKRERIGNPNQVEALIDKSQP